MTRILVVEDENFLAMELTWIVEDAGYSVVGPERSVAETSKMLAWNKVDLALLDINIGGEMVFPVSMMLDTLGGPVRFHHELFRIGPCGVPAPAADDETSPAASFAGTDPAGARRASGCSR
jgi:DNA-binding NarL/FixJ family response regulator